MSCAVAPLRVILIVLIGASAKVLHNVKDLHNEYSNIFKFGNRNAASHIWTTFILGNSVDMTPEQIEMLFSGFCAVSGSPVRPNDYNRYLLSLPLVSGDGVRTGGMYYCCWPCVCDTQDFIRVDTLTVTTAEGPKQYHWAVVGNPCENESSLHAPFVQPFDGRQTTLAYEAREVRCFDGKLAGSTLSDHGYPIISMFFDLPTSIEVATKEAQDAPKPGRVTNYNGVQVQHELEYAGWCADRANNGYNSGMGVIFRKVAEVSPIQIKTQLPPLPSPPNSNASTEDL